MATIVTRETGPSSVNRVLSNGEVDQNFINLNTDKLELAQTYSSAVANGIPYFNNTKVLVTSSTFVFDGTNIGLGIDPIPYTSGNRVFEINGLSAGSEIRLTNTATGHLAGVGGLSIRQTSQDSFIWNAGTGKLSLGAGNQEVLVISNSGAVTVGGNAIVTVGDVGTVTNNMLAGSITNSKLVNSSITVGSTTISLGGTSTTLAGLTSVTSASFVGALTGNASTATTLATARNINGVSFNGSSDITIADSTKLSLTGGTLTGQLIIGATGTGGSPSLRINTSTSTSFVHTQENIAPNLTAGQTAIKVVGQAASTKNSGYIGYYWAGAGSNSNYVSIGHWGADHLLRVYGDGVVIAAGNAIQAGTAFTYDNPGGWGANLVSAGTNHARMRLRATSYNASGDRETYLWLDNTVSPATGLYSNATTFNFNGSISTVQVNGNTVLHAGNYTSYRGIQLVSPNGATVVAADSAMPDAGHSFIHTLGLGPGGNDGHILAMSWANTTSVYGAQLWLDTDPTNTMALRSRSSSGVWNAWSTVLHSTNYNSYSPTLTGTGASGTWGINITGNAATATSASNIDGVAFNNSNSGNPVSAPNTLDSNGIGYVTNISLFGQTDGALYSQAYSAAWQHQIYGDYRTGQIAVRGENNGTWQAWRTVLDSGNYNSYSPTLTGGGASGTWSINVTGTANNITAYTINQSVGTGNSPTFSDIYTNAWFRNNNSGQGLYNQANGNHWYSDASNYWNITTGGAGGIRFRDAHASTIRGYVYSDTSNNIGFLNQNGSWAARVVGGDYWLVDGSSARAPIFYDSNDTTYYLDPNADLSLKVYGEICNSNYGVGAMQPGALNIGRTDTNYGWDGTTWSTDIRAGILANCSETWEFVIHDSGDSVESVFRYDGGDQLLMGRDIGWGTLYIEAANSFRAPIFYDSNNTGYYVDAASTSVLNRISTVRTNDWLYIDQNYGHSIVGVYSSYRYQGVFAMGDSYKLPADGTTTGNLYGLAWSHPNAGGIAANLNTHGLLALENGSWLASFSGSIRCRDDMRAPIFYDNNNTGYYTDPASVSYLYGLTLAGGSYFRPQNWIQMDGNYGMYWPNTGFSGAPHIYPNTGSTYTQFRLDGYKNSYGGIWDSYSAVNIGMFDGSGNGGVYREANGRWFTYYHVGNDCLGIGTSSTNSTWGIYCNKGLYAGSRIDATIYYDANDSGYYIDPNATTAIRTVGDWRANSHDWSGEFSGKIQYHASNWYFQAAGGFQFRNSGGSQLFWCDSSGNVTATGNVTAYSDITLKKNVQTIQNPLELVSRLRGVTFDWIETGLHSYGLIAQEVEQVLPELVQENVPDPNSIDRDKSVIKSVDYSKIVSVLIEAIKDQQSIINSQEDRLAKLEKLLGVNP